jgi:hypothetical protein
MRSLGFLRFARGQAPARLGMTALAASTLLVLAACSSTATTTTTTAPPTAVGPPAANAQATPQSPASRVASGLANLAPTDVGRLIGTTIGASIDISTTPPNVGNADVTQATLNGTDRSGAWGKLDQQARQAFAGAGLELARQAFPHAQLDLMVVDTNGNRLLSASYPPGGQPTYQ